MVVTGPAELSLGVAEVWEGSCRTAPSGAVKKSGSPRLTLRGASRQLIVQVEASNDTTEPRVGTRGSPWAQPGAANHEAKPRYGAMESSPRRKSWEEATNESGAPVGGV